MRILLERHGFEVLEMKIDIVDYAHPAFPKPMNAVIHFGMDVIAKLGLGDNLFVVARKTSAFRS
jgi:hypothetical protein